MKKCLIGMMCISLLLAGCGNTESTSIENTEAPAIASTSRDQEEWLADISFSAVSKMLELASDEAYVWMISNSSEIMDLIREAASVTVDPDEIYVVDVSEDTIKSYIEMSGDFDYETISSVGKEALSKRVPSSISVMISSRQGVAKTAAASILQYSDSFVDLYGIENQVWFLTTDSEGIGVSISFTRTGAGVLTVNAHFVYTGDFSMKEALELYLPNANISKQSLKWKETLSGQGSSA